MIPVRDIVFGLRGAWLLAKGDASGIVWFGNDLGSFWRSFFALFIIAPPYAVLLALKSSVDGADIGFFRYGAINAVIYVMGWFVYPLVVERVSEMVGKREHYLRYICAYNWCAVFHNSIYLTFALLGYSGIINQDMMSFFLLFTFVWVLFYLWVIARVGLDLTPMNALAFVVLDLLLGLFVNALGEGMMH